MKNKAEEKVVINNIYFREFLKIKDDTFLSQF